MLSALYHFGCGQTAARAAVDSGRVELDAVRAEVQLLRDQLAHVTTDKDAAVASSHDLQARLVGLAIGTSSCPARFHCRASAGMTVE